MNIRSKWNHANKGLLAILGVLIFATIGTLVYLASTLMGVQQLVNRGGASAGKVFVLQDLLLSLQDLQNSGRGYVITGNERFLEPYNRALERIPSNMRIIKTSRQMSLNDAETAHIGSLVDKQVKLIRHTVHLRQTEGYEAAQAFVMTGQAETTMTSLRQEINRISSGSLQRLGPMQQRSLSDIRLALGVAGAMGLLVLGICAAVLWYFRRAILAERALEGTKSEFLSLASHQLRTPATNVKQYLSLVMDGYMGELNDQQQKALSVAYRNNEAEIKIMNDLLDVAKLDLNRIQLHKKVTNIMGIARTVVRDARPRAEEKEQRIELIGAKVIMASVDKEYVKGVIQNLVDNAIKYSHKGKHISINVEREQDMICVSVRDRGVGIKKRDHQKLFNKFSRLTNEFSANSEGSGLGLYWVKQVVELHGGRIEVNSQDGRGSTFQIFLPVR
ncbi:MAG TPA: ATP-binding protein [Candidatus Saccharimonadales bacterium]|nr:ATP-binding protein [Candidatus Saccharimonadales bacterium]